MEKSKNVANNAKTNAIRETFSTIPFDIMFFIYAISKSVTRKVFIFFDDIISFLYILFVCHCLFLRNDIYETKTTGPNEPPE